MADPSITVRFGAQIGELLGGVKEIEHAIAGLRAPIDNFVGSLKGIGEALGIAFAVDKVKEFAKAAAELGDNAVAMGNALNMSALEFNNLSGALAIAGVNSDKLIAVFRGLQNAVQAAQLTPESRQGFAFRQLGIDADKFGAILRKSPIEALELLADKFHELGSLGGEAGPFGVLLQRGFPEFAKAMALGKT